MDFSILTVPMKGDKIVTFIPHDELLHAGYVALEDFMVVEANGRFWELQGYDNKAGLWWVEEIVVPNDQEADAGQGVESLGEGGSEGSGGDAQRPSGE